MDERPVPDVSAHVLRLTSAAEVPWKNHVVHVGSGPSIATIVVVVATDSPPTTKEARDLHRDRLGNRAVAVAIAFCSAEFVWLYGPDPDESSLNRPIPIAQAQGILTEALGEPDGVRARTSLSRSVQAIERGGVVGLENRGLFATHYLTNVAPAQPSWESTRQNGEALRELRDTALISALGHSPTQASPNTLLLGSDKRPGNVLAVILRPDESFEASSPRFAVSPIAQGQRIATENGSEWVVLLRGSELRLYPTDPTIAVGTRGQSETYLGLSLSLLSQENTAYLPLLFSADALGHGGSIAQVVSGSQRYAADLSRELRERIYDRAVPTLAVAVAGEFARLGVDDLDVAYRRTLRVLFRLLFQAYGEDTGLLPYGRNDLYSDNSINRWARLIVE